MRSLLSSTGSFNDPMVLLIVVTSQIIIRPSVVVTAMNCLFVVAVSVSGTGRENDLTQSVQR